jgi:hypothetical protein
LAAPEHFANRIKRAWQPAAVRGVLDKKSLDCLVRVARLLPDLTRFAVMSR